MASTFAGHELYSRKALKCLPAQLAFLGAFSTDISGEVLALSNLLDQEGKMTSL